MTDLQEAIAAAREASAALDVALAKPAHEYSPEEVDALLERCINAMGDLLAALDSARGQAVAGSVQSGSVTIPFWVIDYAQKIELFMRINGVDEWAIGGIQSRDLPPPPAPQPAAARSSTVPDGWQLVPKHLPDDVLEAAGAIQGYDGERGDSHHREWWRDVLEVLAAANKENTNE